MRIISRVLAILTALALLAGAAMTATRFDLVRTTAPLDLAETSREIGLSYRNPIPTIHITFFHVAPPDAMAMRVRIDGIWHECLLTQAEVPVQGGGTCAFENTYVTWSRPDNADPTVVGRPVFVNYPIRASSDLIAVTLVLGLMLALGTFYVRSPRRLAAFAGLMLMVPGTVLMTANVAGMLLPLRSPTLAEKIGNYGPDDLRYSYGDAVQLLAWRADDTPQSYATRATETISGAVLHFWTVTELDEVRVIMPLWENWLIRALGQARPEFTEYLFWNPWRTIERGVGLCGHVSSALVGILRERGIDARMVTLFGHVAVTAEVMPGVWHVFDPDLGVVIPHDLAFLEQNEAVVRRYYRPALRVLSAHVGDRQAFEDMLVAAFLASETNHIDPLGRESYHSGLRAFGMWHSELEPFLYRMKWLIPAGLMLLGAAIVAAAWLWPRPRADAYAAARIGRASAPT